MSAWRGALLTGLCVLLVAPAAQARKRERSISRDALPEWVQQALDREIESAGADAVWLHEEVRVAPLAEGGVRFHVRRAARLLRQAALPRFNAASHYYRKSDTLETVRAFSIDPDGRAIEADPEKDVETAPAMAGFSVFDDSRIRWITLPRLRVGSVAAWEYSWVAALDTGATRHVFGSASRPTAWSRVSLELPEGWHYDLSLHNDESLEIDRRQNGASASASQLGRLTEERLGPSASTLLPSVWLRWWDGSGARGFSDWNAVGRWYGRLTRGILGSSGEAKSLSSSLAPKQPGEFWDALDEAFRFAAREVRYVSIQVGIGGYRPDTPASVCSNRYGDCKAKSFLLRALIEPWGFETYPVLVRTRSRGPLDREVPSPAQFNHCIFAVRLPEEIVEVGRQNAGGLPWTVVELEGIGRVLLLDPTDSRGSPYALPTADQATIGLLVHAEGARLIEIPSQPPSEAAVRRRLAASASPGGGLSMGRLTEEWTGTEATRVRSYWEGRTDAEREAQVLEDLQQRFPGARVFDYTLERDLENGDLLRETTVFSGGKIGLRTGGLLLLEPGRLGVGVIGQALAPPPRRWPLAPGLPKREEIHAELRVPSGWSPESLPEALRIETPEIRGSCSWSFADETLIFDRTAELLVSEIAPERYEAFREAVLRLSAADREAIVLTPQ